MTRERVLVLGTGTFAQEIADLVDDCPGHDLAGFVENLDPRRTEDPILGKPVYWVDELVRLKEDHVGVCGLGTTWRSLFVDQAADFGLRFTTIVHPSAHISTRSVVGMGTSVNRNVVVASQSELSEHVVVNRSATIGHHTRIGPYATLGPAVHVAGNCTIGEATYLGIGSIVIDNVKIGHHAVVAAGAVVTEDVPDHVLVAGVPAVIKKRKIRGK